VFLCLLRTFFVVEVATTAPHTARGLSAVDPDVAELLAVIALR
jgi:hypothetical protein